MFKYRKEESYMKKGYEAPSAKIQKFEVEEAIMLSIVDSGDDSGIDWGDIV